MSSHKVDFFKLSSDILTEISYKDLKHLEANLCVDEQSKTIKQTIDKSFTDETILQTEGKETKSFSLGETTFGRRSFSIDIPNFVQYDQIYSFALFDKNKSITTARAIKKSSTGPRCYCFHQDSYLKNLKSESSARTGDFRILLCFVSFSSGHARLEWFLTKNTFLNDGKKKEPVDTPETVTSDNLDTTDSKKSKKKTKSTKRKSTNKTTKSKKKKLNQDEMDDAVSVETESNCQQEQSIVQEENLQASVGNLPVTAQFSQNTFPIPAEFNKKLLDIFQSYNQLFSEHTKLKKHNNDLLKENEELKQKLKLDERNDDQYVSQVLDVNLPAAATQVDQTSLDLLNDELFLEDDEKENSQEKKETSMKTLEFSGVDHQPIIAEKETFGQDPLMEDDEFWGFK